ncbi:phosphatidylglycerophosphatase A [Mariprofundus ferrinatatus]|uniref:Phosphatidylglycerophosphatase A n=1 Tax=Mariprofundus ferrinatatus TaxID=1921087 RepID=A0A2K8L408_9PROT|nr:phosphatidylglycerophosphatase A [Mariprofundus ferrinatatus]ATX82065.1 phosphatidylglycerophosphatase A [Mariprofundus ferrinatatus]
MAESRTIHHWLAAGFGSGWLPRAPGTWGSLTSLLPAWFLVEQSGALTLIAASLMLLVLGCWNCSIVLPQLADKDPGWIVIDEWVGQWLCLGVILIFLDSSFAHMAVAFIAFRGFDVFKPWPVSYVETLGPPWWSIMADDVVAGLMGATVVVVGSMALGG